MVPDGEVGPPVLSLANLVSKPLYVLSDASERYASTRSARIGVVMADVKRECLALLRPTTNDLECRWYVAEDGQMDGPLSYDRLAERARGGTLRRTQHLWRPGFDQWIAVSARRDLVAMMPERPHLGVVPSSVEAALALPTEELHLSRDVVDERPSCMMTADLPLDEEVAEAQPTSSTAATEGRQLAPRVARTPTLGDPEQSLESVIPEWAAGVDDVEDPSDELDRALEVLEDASGELEAALEGVDGDSAGLEAALEGLDADEATDGLGASNARPLTVGGLEAWEPTPALTHPSGEPFAETSTVSPSGALDAPGTPDPPSSLEDEQIFQQFQRGRRNRLIRLVVLVVLLLALGVLVVHVEGGGFRVEREPTLEPRDGFKKPVVQQALLTVPPKTPSPRAAPASTVGPNAREKTQRADDRDASASRSSGSSGRALDLSDSERAAIAGLAGAAQRSDEALVTGGSVPRRFRLRAPEPEAVLETPIILPSGLSDDSVGHAVSARRSAFARCARFDRLSGVVPAGSKLLLLVSGGGRVERAIARGAPPEVAACLERTGHKLVFRPFTRSREQVELRFARAGTVRARVLRTGNDGRPHFD